MGSDCLRKIINTAFIKSGKYLNYKCLSDEKYLKLKVYLKTGKKLNLENPQTFVEKMQWLKLYDRKPIYTKMADKIEAKKIAAEILGEEYVIPTLGIYNSFDEIDFEKLPNQFVLKASHNSGGVIVCEDKDRLDIDRARQRLNKSMKGNFYWGGREWPYKNIKPRILAEKYMTDDNSPDKTPIDYKFYCFNGEPKFLYVCNSNIKSGQKNGNLTYLDLDFKETPFQRTDHERYQYQIEKPNRFDEMIECARKMSKDTYFLRADLYYMNNHIYFSEFTFTPGSGFTAFEPEEWDKKIGSWIELL